MRKNKFTGESWTHDDIENFWEEIDLIGKEWGFDYEQPQIEIMSSDQMIEAMSTIGAPCSYDHWSVGKQSIELQQQYKAGKSGLALEMIINSSPPIMYIMENNTLMQQGLVLAHAGVGHASFFKNNYLFKQWTDPTSILEYFTFAKDYIKKCELDHGVKAVEHIIDICHSLQWYGISYHKRSRQKHLKDKFDKYRDEYLYEHKTLSDKDKESFFFYKLSSLKSAIKDDEYYQHQLPEENILYFIEKNSPVLEDWQREIIRITRKLAEYFYPQRRTKIMNEGWATFLEKMIFEELYTKKIIDEGGYLELIRDHANVCAQHSYKSKYYNGHMNPYAIGFAIFNDLYRMTHSPTKENLKEYPEICNTDWKESLYLIVKNYCDYDFISRYLTKNVIDRYKLFLTSSLPLDGLAYVKGTARDIDDIREVLAASTDIFEYLPRLEIGKGTNQDVMYIDIYESEDKLIDTKSIEDIGWGIHTLWGGKVKFEHSSTKKKEK